MSATGTGGSAATRVCAAAHSAAAASLRGKVALRVAASDPVNIECLLHGSRTRLDVVAQASAQAWVQFDTLTVHQMQVYTSGSLHESRQIPRAVHGLGGVADWIPAQDELVATNGTPTRGGSYVTVTVAGKSPPGSARSALASAVARATLALAPRGPDPG